MKNVQLLPLTLAAGWMLAPESLVLLGNGVGQNGIFFLPVVTMTALLIAACVNLLCDNALPFGPGRNVTILDIGLNPIVATTISISGRLPIVLLAATALLVTAGYTFNEVFLYWFPNFGFSFLLLGIILLLNLVNERFGLYSQTFFVLMAFLGLLLLGLTGLFSAGNPSPDFTNEPIHFSGITAAGSLLLFLGYEAASGEEKPATGKKIILFSALSLIMVLFVLWAVVSMRFVPLHRLADSTIPYATTAGKILGEPGRMLMGAVIISGTCAAINGFFLITRRTFTGLVRERLTPNFPGLTWKGRLLPLLLAVVIGIMMMTGLAGDEILETYLRGALLLWLLHNSVLCLAASRLIAKTGKSKPIYGYFCSGILALTCMYLLVNDTQAKELSAFCLSILAGSVVFAVSCKLFVKKLS